MTQSLNGARIRADMDAALARASRDAGQPLEFTEQETELIDMAVLSADRAALLRELFTAEQEGEGRPRILVPLSTEIRCLDKAVVDLVGRVNPGVGAGKSPRHVRAASVRWERERAAEGGA